MKKVINITLGSIVFAIDEDAYDDLASYLDQIKGNLVNNDDAKEIINDIEIAIAEKFIACNRSEKMAVSTVDVEAVIKEMGSPAEFGHREEGERNPGETSHNREPDIEQRKRLYRDKDTAVVAGVASGLANYFDTDPVIVRLIFVILIFFNGLGLFAYFIFWLAVPIAETTAQKYAMRGEQVTLRDISQRVKKNIDDTEKSDDPKAKGLWATFRRFLDTSFQVLGLFLKCIISLLWYVVGVAIILVSAFGLAGLAAAYSVIMFRDMVIFGPDVVQIFENLRGTALGITALVSLFISIVIPLVVSIMLGISLLTKRCYFTIQKSVTLVVFWIVASVLATVTITLQAERVIQQFGPINGRADDSGFEVEWKNGIISVDEQNDQLMFEEKGVDPTGSTTRTTRYRHNN